MSTGLLARTFLALLWGEGAPHVLIGAPCPKLAPVAFTALLLRLKPNPSAGHLFSGTRPFGRCIARLLMIAWASSGYANAFAEKDSENLFHFGLTARMFRGINENDGRAAIKVYIESVGKERGIDFAPSASFDQVQSVGRALRSGQLDAASVTTEEYLQIIDAVASVHVFDEPGRPDPGEEYLLLVHKESPITGLAGLKGGVLIEYDNLRTSLARMWLDVSLLEQGLARSEDLFAAVTLERKLTTVVLPVFFGKAQACLVTRRGFETMSELNPQVGKSLRVLASSPGMVSTVMCFGPKANPAHKTAILQGIQRLHEQPRGQQLLTVFQGGARMVEYPPSCLDRAKKLKARHDELLKKFFQLPVSDSQVCPPREVK